MIERTLRSARVLVAALAAGPILVAVVATFVRPPEPQVPDEVAFGIVLAGIVAPSIGWRLARRPEGGAAPRSEDEGCRRFLRATVAGLAVTEAGAMAGAVLWLLGSSPVALVPLALHAVLSLALWPTGERLADFLGRA